MLKSRYFCDYSRLRSSKLRPLKLNVRLFPINELLTHINKNTPTHWHVYGSREVVHIYLVTDLFSTLLQEIL